MNNLALGFSCFSIAPVTKIERFLTSSILGGQLTWPCCALILLSQVKIFCHTYFRYFCFHKKKKSSEHVKHKIQLQTAVCTN